MILALLLVFGQGLKAQVYPPVDVIATPSVINAAVGESFTVIIQLDANDAFVSVADIHMLFDPNVINVTSTSYAPGTPLFVQTFAPYIDNVNGAWGRGGYGFQTLTTLSDFLVVNCLVVGPGSTTMTYLTDADFPVLLAYDGQDVTGELFPVQINPGSFDCPDLGVNNGDPCMINGLAGTYVDCECAANPPVITGGSIPALNNCAPRNVTLSLYNTGDFSLSQVIETSIGLNGGFTMAVTAPGTYNILVKVDGYLAKMYSNQVIAEGGGMLVFSGLHGGDLNNSNSVNLVDISVMNLSMGAAVGEDNYNFLADINCDGWVNLIDVSVLNTTFGMTGDVPLSN